MNEPRIISVIDIESENIPLILRALSESRDEIQDLEVGLALTELAREKESADFFHLAREKDNFVEQLKTLGDEVHNLKETIDFMDRTAQRSYWEKDKLVVERNDALSRLEVTQNRLDETQRSLAALANSPTGLQCRSCDEVIKSSHDLQQQLEVTQSRLEEATKQYHDLESRFWTVAKLREETAKELITTRQALANSQEWLHDAQAQVASLECRACDDVEKRNDDLQQENANWKESLALEVEENKRLHEVMRIAREMSASNHSEQVLQKNVANLKDSYSREVHENKRLRGVIGRLQDKIQGLLPRWWEE